MHLPATNHGVIENLQMCSNVLGLAALRVPVPSSHTDSVKNVSSKPGEDRGLFSQMLYGFRVGLTGNPRL